MQTTDPEAAVEELAAALTRERAERERLDVALAAAHMGTWDWDLQADQVYWSPQLEAIHGFEPGGLGSHLDRYFAHLHADDAERVRNSITAALTSGELAVEYRGVTPGGELKWFEARGRLAHDADGQAIALRGVCVDVSARKRAEQAQRWTGAVLAGERRVLAMLTQGVPLAQVLETLCLNVEELAGDGLYASILMLDPDGQHLRHGAGPSLPDAYNQAIDGVAIGPSVGSCGTAAYRGQQVIVSDIDTDPLWADFRELALGHGLRACWSTPVRATDGRLLGTFALYYSRPRSPSPEHLLLADLVGRTAAMVLERSQIDAIRARLLATERQARADAEAAIQMRDQFVAVVSHDLRNPLTALRGQLSLLRRRATRAEPLPVEQLVERLDSIDATTQLLTGQIDELLDATRLQAGRPLELTRRPMDLVALARDAVRKQQLATDGHQVRFETTTPELVGAWDQARLQRVLANLLSNALKFSPDGGEVLVRTQQAGDEALLMVADHGLGIPTADLPGIFERYQRASNVVGRIAGSGLGLAGVRELVRLHGGSIDVHSVEGQGTTFTVRLPLESANPG